METATLIIHGMTPGAERAVPPASRPLPGSRTQRRMPTTGQEFHRGSRDPRTARPLRRALAVMFALLVASALSTQARSRPHNVIMHTIVVGHLPDALALAPGTNRAFVANDAGATVSSVDLTARHVLRTVSVGHPGTLAPLALAVDARSHHLFVANRGDNGGPGLMRSSARRWWPGSRRKWPHGWWRSGRPAWTTCS